MLGKQRQEEEEERWVLLWRWWRVWLTINLKGLSQV